MYKRQSPEITNLQHSFDSLRQVFDLTLAHEVKVTQAIQNLLGHCIAVKDFSTFTFLQWFATEQTEEEIWARRAIELFDVIGEEGVGLYTIDRAIGALSEDKS